MTIKNSQSGFSLVEMVIVILIAGAIVAVYTNLPNTLGLVTTSNHEAIAKEIVARKINEIRSSGYANLANGTTNISDSKLTQIGNASGTILIGDCPLEVCSNSEPIKKVTITVNWNDSGKPYSYQIVTLVAQGGLK